MNVVLFCPPNGGRYGKRRPEDSQWYLNFLVHSLFSGNAIAILYRLSSAWRISVSVCVCNSCFEYILCLKHNNMILKLQVFGSRYFYFSRGKNCLTSLIDLSRLLRASGNLIDDWENQGGNRRGKRDGKTRHFTACCLIFPTLCFFFFGKLRKRNKLL